MTGERKTELDKDALEKARQAYEQIRADNCTNNTRNSPLEAAITAYLTALPQSALSSRLLKASSAVYLAAHADVAKELSALLREAAAALGGIPEGWVLVPVEPTEEMIAAGCRHENMGDMAGRYKAMCAAKPPPGELGPQIRDVKDVPSLHETVLDHFKTPGEQK